MKTPIAPEIQYSLKDIWGCLAYKEKAILNTSSTKESDCLLVHAEKGSLSDIPLSTGTERNGNSHGHKNKFYTGKELASSLHMLFLPTSL